MDHEAQSPHQHETKPKDLPKTLKLLASKAKTALLHTSTELWSRTLVELRVRNSALLNHMNGAQSTAQLRQATETASLLISLMTSSQDKENDSGVSLHAREIEYLFRPD